MSFTGKNITVYLNDRYLDMIDQINKKWEKEDEEDGYIGMSNRSRSSLIQYAIYDLYMRVFKEKQK